MAYFGGDSRSARGIKPASVGETDAPEEVDEGHAGNGDSGVGKPAARAGRRGNIGQATGPFVGVASLTMLRTDRTASLAPRRLARKSVEPEIAHHGWAIGSAVKRVDHPSSWAIHVPGSPPAGIDGARHR